MKPDPIEELLLRAYPNPERKGCPGSETIQALANKDLPHSHPAWEHVWKCSPCFAEFRELRDARRARERSARRRRAAYVGVIAAILLVCIGAALTILFSRGRATPRPPEVVKAPPPVAVPANPAAVLNLGISPTRSGDEKRPPGSGLQIQRLPHHRVDLTVYLPRGSDEGDYQLEMLDSQDDVVISANGKAVIDRGLTRFTTAIDLAKIPPGTYQVKSRRVPDGTWHSSTVIVERQ